MRRYKAIDTDQKNIGESWELSGVPGNESVVSNGEFAGRTITELIKEYGPELLGLQAMGYLRSEAVHDQRLRR